MANKETVRVRKQQPGGGRMSVAIEYVGAIAIVCLFAGAMIGWSVAPRAAGGHDHGAGMNTSAGSDEAAIQAALERIEHETNYEALVEIGNHAYEKGRPDVAIPAYEKALTINPNDPNVLSDLGAMYISVGRADKAVELNKKAVALDPNHTKSRYNLGIAYVNAGDKAAARKTFEEVIKLGPSSQEASDSRQRLKEIAK